MTIQNTLLRRHVSRRGFTFGAVSAAGLLAGTSRVLAQGQVNELTYLNYGGLYGKSQRAAMIDPFIAAHGIRVATPSGPDAIATLFAQSQRDEADIDVIALTDVQVVTTIKQGGMLAELDPANIPNAKDLPGLASRAPFAYNIEFAPWGLMYRTDKVDAPTSWRALFEPENPERTAFVRPQSESGSLFNMLAGSLIEGGTEEDVLTLGVPRIQQLRAQGAQFVDFGGALAQMQNDGIDFTTMFSNEAYFMASQGLPIGFAFPKEGAFPVGVWLGVPTTLASERREAVETFINWIPR